MRISMWMLLDRLGELSPVPHIESGKRVLRNARLLSESRGFPASTLFLQQNAPGSVMCMNGHDIMMVPSDDISFVLNCILDAFDRLNDWSDRADECIRRGCDLEELLELASQESGMGLVVNDATYLTYAHTPVQDLSGNGGWQEAVEKGSMDLDVILGIDADPRIRLEGAEPFCTYVPQYEGTWAAGSIYLNGEHQGWVVGDKEGGDFSQGDLDMLDAIRSKIEDWLRLNGGGEALRSYTGVLSRLLEGERVDSGEAARVLSVYGWDDSCQLRVYAFCRAERDGRPMLAIERFLRQLGKNALSVLVGDEIALVVNEDREDLCLLRDGMADVLRASGYVAGESPSFRGIIGLRSNYLAAQVAMRSALGSGRMLVAFDDVRLDYIVKLVEDNAVADVRHPALATLREYDGSHDTQLAETLVSFVRNRGSYIRAYEELFIHRSTLTYRLERIAELTGIDYADERVWTHLALSILIDEASPVAAD